MIRTFTIASLIVLGLLLFTAPPAWAATIATVPVGNPGNAGQLSGDNAFEGPERITGAVAYAYNIGTYEVTAGQYAEFLNAVAATDTYGLYDPSMSRIDYGSGITRAGASGSYTYTVAADFVNRPATYASFARAARFSNWLHNGQPTGVQDLSTTEDGSYLLNGANDIASLQAVTRSSGATWAIPTEDEWYKAAYHKNDGATGNYFNFPTSSDTGPARDMLDVGGNNANIFAPGASGTYPIDSGKYTTLVGEFQNSASPYGTFDQGGNLWEWTEAIIANPNVRGLRGGAWVSLDDQTYGTYRAHLSTPTLGREKYGFRVVQLVPEPASLALLGVGAGAGMMLWRRR